MDYKKNNLPIVAVLCVGFCNISRKLMVNWGLELENFLKRSSYRRNLQVHYSAAWQSFTAWDVFFNNTIKEKLDDDLCWASVSGRGLTELRICCAYVAGLPHLVWYCSLTMRVGWDFRSTFTCCLCNVGSGKETERSMQISCWMVGTKTLLNAAFDRSEWGCCLQRSTGSRVSRDQADLCLHQHCWAQILSSETHRLF